MSNLSKSNQSTKVWKVQMNFNVSPLTDWSGRARRNEPAALVSGSCVKVWGDFKGDKKERQGSEYHLVDKTATPLSTGYIRFIASGSELRPVRREKEKKRRDDWKWNPGLRVHSAWLLSSLNTDIRLWFSHEILWWWWWTIKNDIAQ